MPNTVGRNRSLSLCFTKTKRPLPPRPSSSFLSPHQLGHPTLVKNFNSLYENTFDSSASATPSSSSSSSDVPDLATVLASQRFFFSSPGRSNSIIESTPSIATSTESSDTLVGIKCNVGPDSDTSIIAMNHSNHEALVDNCNHHQSCQSGNSPTVKDSVAVPTYSPDPYRDFRRSMQEMVEARDLVDVKANWDYLHELLLCYLNLNPQSTHKFIVGAFADLLVSLLSKPRDSGGHRTTDFSGGGCEISRQHM